MKHLTGALTAAALTFVSFMPAWAEQTMSAKVLLTLTGEQRTYYVGGIIHTLMLHTIIMDDGDHTRANCISNWYFKGEGPEQIKSALVRFPNDSPASLAEAMARLECGKGKEKESPNLKRYRGD